MYFKIGNSFLWEILLREINSQITKWHSKSKMQIIIPITIIITIVIIN